jgi:hypothetical protein
MGDNDNGDEAASIVGPPKSICQRDVPGCHVRRAIWRRGRERWRVHSATTAYTLIRPPQSSELSLTQCDLAMRFGRFSARRGRFAR